MIDIRLQHFIEKHNIIPESQNGFRKSKSCQHALTQLISDIHLANNNKHNTCCALIDIKSAFDDVCPYILDNILQKLKIPYKTRMFIFNLITNRQLFFKIGNKLTGPYSKSTGVPQGCVLSPLLYNIYVSELMKTLPQDIQLIQYADDTIFYYSDTDNQKSIQKIETTLSLVNTFFQTLNLKISPEKTKFIIFTKSPFESIRNYTLKFNNTEISPSEKVKYLGLYLDYKLSWNDQATYTIGRATKLLNVLKALRGTWWGGHPQILLTAYTSLIRSTIEYGAFLINISNPSLKNKLQIIQNQGIRLALGYRNSTPINVLHAESKIPHISFRIQYLSDKFIIKLISNEQSSFLKKINNLNNNLLMTDKHNIHKSYPLIKSFRELSSLTQNKIEKYSHPIPYDYEYEVTIDTPNIDTKTGIKIKKSKNIPEEFNKIFHKTLTTTYSIFTDASKKSSTNHTGLTYYAPSTNTKQQFKTLSQSSIFSAEALAIIMAIHHINSSDKKNATIFRDSLSVLKAIENFNPIKTKNTSHYIMDIKSLLYNSKMKNIKISLIWIPAHCKIPHNEIVDSLAKEAIEKGVNLITFLPPSDFTEEIKKKTQKRRTPTNHRSKPIQRQLLFY